MDGLFQVVGYSMALEPSSKLNALLSSRVTFCASAPAPAAVLPSPLSLGVSAMVTGGDLLQRFISHDDIKHAGLIIARVDSEA